MKKIGADLWKNSGKSFKYSAKNLQALAFMAASFSGYCADFLLPVREMMSAGFFERNLKFFVSGVRRLLPVCSCITVCRWELWVSWWVGSILPPGASLSTRKFTSIGNARGKGMFRWEVSRPSHGNFPSGLPTHGRLIAVGRPRFGDFLREFSRDHFFVFFSVVGLNFDFLALNLTGFICYSVYNCLLYWCSLIQARHREFFYW